jgi:Na+/H+ antiporter NhaC
MRRRTRILIALAFGALFALVGAPDTDEGRPHLGYLMVREWLLGGESPLAAWHAERTAVQLLVDLRTSPPIEDEAVLRARTQEYARLAEEWRLGHRDDARGNGEALALPLVVLVGERGVRATLPGVGGRELRLERVFPSRLSLLPAALAIVLAVLTQRVLPSLFLACFAGAIAHVVTAVPGAHPGAITAVVDGFVHFVGDAFWRRSIGEDFYLRITVFVVFLFMTVGVITQNGGVHGLVRRLQRIVRGPASAQGCTIAAGGVVFFDDYTNCLLVSTTMRPLCDQHGVSREKLAWLVDSTAAPVAGLSVFSTWVVYEMSQYQAPLTMVTRPDGTPYIASDAFEVFLQSLPFRFYSWFCLALVVLVVVLRRDYGPMLRAERRARGGQTSPDADECTNGDADAAPPPGVPLRARNAVIPLLVLVLGTVGVMVAQGTAGAGDAAGRTTGEYLRQALSHARSDEALLWAAMAAFAVAVALTRLQRLASWRTIGSAALRACRALPAAFGILFLAWSLGHLCRDLGTSFFLTATARGAMTAAALPLVLFLVASAMAFATGTSFGTMAILLPNVVVLSHQLGTDAGFGGSPAAGGTALMLLSIGAVLEGSIFGDHCSPISDTTVLSSIGSRCPLMAHVTTQLPYALLAMAAATLAGYVPMLWFGPGAWPVSMAAGLLLMAGFLLLVGRDATIRQAPTPDA